jgi:uncharacterized protein (TIGR03435 family)
MRRWRTVFALAIGLILVVRGQHDCHAQAPSGTASFEVASIRMVDPHTATDLQRGIGLFSMSSFPTNLLTVKNAPLAFLVQFAYGVDSQDHITGMPDWMELQEYDLSAKIEGDQQLTLVQMQPMLKQLLSQRFHLAVHHETKNTPGFALVLAKGGPKLQLSKNDSKPSAQMLSNRLEATHMDTAHFVGVLAHRAGQPVIDKTGLTGIYDFRLSYAPANDPSSSLPDLFTALQEQLGLKLESQKVPVEMLVIDHADKIPTEN